MKGKEDFLERKGSKYFFKEGNFFYILRVEENLKEEIKFHSHDFVEICYVYSGSGYHTLDNKEYKVQKGDLFIINHDHIHGFYKSDSNDTLVTYNILFTPGFFDNLLINFNDFSSLTMSYLFRNVWSDSFVEEDLRLDPIEQKTFDMLISNMYSEYTLQQTGYMNIIRAYMIELVINMMRCFKKRSIEDEAAEKKASALEEIIKYLNENYMENISLNHLAMKSFFSKNYLCKLFKETTGITIFEYTQNLRIVEACKLLQKTNNTILDIALEVGFSDYKFFSNVFKRIKGVTPSQYRKSHDSIQGRFLG